MTALTTFIILSIFYGTGFIFHEPVCSIDDGRYNEVYGHIDDRGECK